MSQKSICFQYVSNIYFLIIISILRVDESVEASVHRKAKLVVEGIRDRNHDLAAEYLPCLKEDRHSFSNVFLNVVSRIRMESL